MAQGQDRIAQSLLDLEPTAIVELFLLYFDTVDKPDSFIAFHGGSVFNRGIVWQGITYLPIPVETEGFEVKANGELARPKMRIANKDYFVTDLLVNNNDLQFAKVIRKRTFVKYLDDVNFDGGNPWGQADATAEISKDTFVIGQKTAENKSYVEFELTSPLDLENFEVNNRLIMAKYCSWYYRGNGCNYNGIPIETEDGRSLTLSDPAKWNELGEWKVNVSYLSGQAAYLENKKITIANPQDSTITEFAKIWYVCQQNHTSSLDKKPDENENFWLRDGCNKKLNGCRKRFGVGLVQFNERTESRTALLVDFQSRTGNWRFNNIAPAASVTSTSTSDLGSGPRSAVDNSLTSEWIARNTTNPLLVLNWANPVRVSRINIYDRASTSFNINNALVTYFNANLLPTASGTVTGIPTNGNRATTGFSPIDVKRITVSGISGLGTANGLREISVFEDNSPHLVYQDEESVALHRRDFFQISTQIALTGRSQFPTELYSVFHNIGGVANSRYSGINLYLSGSQLRLEFATRRTGQGLTVASTPQTLSIPWSNDSLRPIHLICSGGIANGVSPTTATAGYIRITDGQQDATFALSSVSGQYFHFKNSSYQTGILSGTSGYKFGLNDWQFPTGTDLAGNPPAATTLPPNFLKLHSPIQFARTAIWTGVNGINSRINLYNEQNFLYKRYDEISFKPEVSDGLLGLWDMEIDDSGFIAAENNTGKRLRVIGVAETSPLFFQTESAKNITTTTSTTILKQSETLPFGGFPGTEKYG
jgi:lambda family phage minor tail protein L